MKKNGRRRELLFACAFLLLTAMLVNFCSDVLRPERTNYGSTWTAFRSEPKNSIDVLYLGSSYAYCNFNPTIVYESSGLTGYVMGGSEQTLSLSYWYLKESLKTQKPQAVVLEASGLFFFGPYQNFTQFNVGFMPFGLNKLGAILTAAEPELRFPLLFDLSLYHTRWKELGLNDIRKAFSPFRPDALKGHTAINGIQPGATFSPSVGGQDVSGENYLYNLSWLKKSVDLCVAEGIIPIIIFNPTFGRCSEQDYAKVAGDIQALSPEVRFCNLAAALEEIGLDGQQHFYDGAHLNQDGAAIYSAWLGSFFLDEIGLTPMVQSAENTAAWESSVRYWENLLAQ